MRFLSSRRKTKDRPSATAARPHPLAAVPLRGEGVEARISERGELHLRVTLPSGGTVAKTLNRLGGSERTRQVILDEKGAFFWKQIDGENNLFDIRQALQREYRLSAEESNQSTILFIKMLMRRHFIRIQMDTPGNSAP